MPLESISSLARLTGMATRTIRARLEDLTPVQDGKALKFETRQALPLLYQVEDIRGGFSLEQERARLAARQADKVEIELGERSGQLIPFELIEMIVGSAFAEVRAGLLGQHNMIAAEFPEIPNDAIVGIARMNRDLLQALAETPFPPAVRAALEKVDEGG